MSYSDLDTAAADLTTVSNQMQYVKDNATKLTSDLAASKASINTLMGACGGCLPAIDTTGFNVGFDENQVNQESAS